MMILRSLGLLSSLILLVIDYECRLLRIVLLGVSALKVIFFI